MTKFLLQLFFPRFGFGYLIIYLWSLNPDKGRIMHTHKMLVFFFNGGGRFHFSASVVAVYSTRDCVICVEMTVNAHQREEWHLE